MMKDIRALALALKDVGEGRMREAQRVIRERLKDLPAPAPERSAVPFAVQLRVFERDRFHCRYCGTKTIFVPALRLISVAFPREFPFDPHWRVTKTHRAFWLYAASCDHVLPRSRGGKTEERNLATACYRCNAAKGHFTLEELGWALHPAPDDPWDGLLPAFRKLAPMAVLRIPSLRVWIAAVEAGARRRGAAGP